MENRLQGDELRQAIEKREAEKERLKALATDQLKTDFTDRYHWAELAAAKGLRLPAHYIPAGHPWGLRAARKCLRKVGASEKDFARINALSLRGWCVDNPTWPAFALVGLILEDADCGAFAKV